MIKGKKIAIVTSCLDDWGGSEELWAKSIHWLQEAGVGHITIYKNTINAAHPEFVKLKRNNVTFAELDPKVSRLKKLRAKLADPFQRALNIAGLAEYSWNKPVTKLQKYLKASPPDLVIVSQGINFDGLAFAYECLKLNIPYITIAHKAVDFYWPQPADREHMKQTLLQAKKCLFVSNHTKNLTEEQFGVRFPNGDIVINPVKTSVDPLPFPATDKGYRLACVGRLFIIDKGQDILFRILSQPKWRERDIRLSVIGSGPDAGGLKDMVQLLELDNVDFVSFTTDIKQLWSNHHALILPSRSEGLPLTIIEAMSMGRPVIVTNAGGNSEIINDQVTGFVSEINETDLDRVMELAWSKRGEWENIGLQAAEHIKKSIPETPERIFVKLINNILND